MNIQCNKNYNNVIQARRPDIITVSKKQNKCIIVDVAIPGDRKIYTRNWKKLENEYRFRKVWDVRAIAILVVTGAFSSVPMKNNLKVIDVEISVGMIQKCALLGSARYLKRCSRFKGEEIKQIVFLGFPRKRFREKVNEVNKVLAFIETKHITHTNKLLLHSRS